MKLRKIRTVYFSPVGRTAQIARFLTEQLAEERKLPFACTSYTLPGERSRYGDGDTFASDELLLWATPVYAGRIPNMLLPFVKSAMQGSKTPSIAIVVYGNRNYDNALAELTGIMKENNCHPIAAAAVPAQHAFTGKLAAGRPDAADFSLLKHFCRQIAEKIRRAQCLTDLTQPQVHGEAHPDAYYTPKKEDGTPAVFLKALPVCDAARCTGCGTCGAVCPMETIRLRDDGVPTFSGICIKCHACLHHCPEQALHFDSPELYSHIRMLEQHFTARREIECFL